ncbi:MAG: prolipoprotein diacylglyceryl transferase [Candidatus Melainabacteria bacterium]|nr:prolipoprotein diacylglyceryl transferase [Candidatus Melainabacteria bacterium]
MTTMLSTGSLLTFLAYLAGMAIFYVFSLKRGFNKRPTLMVMLAGLAGGVIGAKLTRMLFLTGAGLDPLSLFTHPDGRTITGGVLFGWLAVELAKKRLGLKRSTGDGFALALSFGEFAGRLGCFFNSCCCGAAAVSIPWAVYQDGALRHPAQLYSAAWSLTIFLSLLLAIRFLPGRREGDLFRYYLIAWGSGRFVLEFFRDRTEVVAGLSLAQWLSLEIALAMAIGLFVRARKKETA